MLKFHRIAVCSPEVRPGDISYNVAQIAKLYKSAAKEGAAVVLTPELSVTGYSCGDGFLLESFLEGARAGLLELAKATRDNAAVLIAGLPLAIGAKVYDVAAVIQGGAVQAFVGKTWLENFRGANEVRRFASIEERNGEEVEFDGCLIPCGANMLFNVGNGLVFGCEIGADADAVTPPSADMALFGAVAIFHPTAQLVDVRYDYPAGMVEATSKRLLCAYVSAGAGAGESTCNGVFDGRVFSAVCGKATWQEEGAMFFSDINCGWIRHQRRIDARFGSAVSSNACETILLVDAPTVSSPVFADIDSRPFEAEYDAGEVIDLQARALAKRVEATGCKRLVLGISGGLDSTLALLASAACCDLLGCKRDFILAVTMPGMGTTARTKGNAEKLVESLGAELREISIKNSVLQHFKDIGHDPKLADVTYENSQARERTQILMDLANQEYGIVVGTGDMSEIALGWSTFNGDHMSMYCINAGVPKTLIRAAICNYADALLGDEKPKKAALALVGVLDDIVETPVSPELLPGGSNSQKTEDILGSYDLHDFYLYYFLKYGESKANILELAKFAFGDEFKVAEIKRTLDLFMKRFFCQQYKRNAAPEGPQIVDFSLDACTGWNMPSDIGMMP